MEDEERLNEIVSILKEKQNASVYSLASKLYVSESTIRRDLNKLEQKGFLIRTFGGAIFKNSGQNTETSYFIRSKENVQEKMKLARAVTPYLRDNMVISIDSSSTCIQLINILNSFKNLTIVTNGLMLANQILSRTQHRVKLLGGDLSIDTESSEGIYAEEMISKLHCSLCILSTAGMDAKFGFTENLESQSSIKRKMKEHADKTIVLVGDEKLNKVCLAQSMPISGASVVVTNTPLSEEFKKSAPETEFICTSNN